MGKMREKRIACLTYNKYPGKDCPVSEFALQEVRLVSGQTVAMSLAERASSSVKTVRISNPAK